MIGKKIIVSAKLILFNHFWELKIKFRGFAKNNWRKYQNQILIGHRHFSSEDKDLKKNTFLNYVQILNEIFVGILAEKYWKSFE